MAKTLRTQFMDYMTLNRYSKWTIQHYMDIVKRLAKYFNKSPDLISQEEIQEYLLYLLRLTPIFGPLAKVESAS